MNRRAHVLLNGRQVGILEESNDDIRFVYLPEWLADPRAVPVSLTLPLRAEPYITRGLHSFFENLLPEGWLLEVSSKSLKVSKDDPFGLLLATCRDCVGALEIVPVELGGES